MKSEIAKNISRREFLDVSSRILGGIGSISLLSMFFDSLVSAKEGSDTSIQQEQFLAANIYDQWHAKALGIKNQFRDPVKGTIAVLESGLNPNQVPYDHTVRSGRDYTNSGSTLDKYGHGTRVANALSLLSPLQDVVVHKIYDDKGRLISNESVANSIVESVEIDGASGLVLCMALLLDKDGVIYKALEYAGSKGVWAAISTGNRNLDDPESPARFAEFLPNIIPCAGLTSALTPATWTNHAGKLKDSCVYAPGESIPSLPDNITGTSASTPLVAAVLGYITSAVIKQNPAKSEIDRLTIVRNAFYQGCTPMNLPFPDESRGIPNLAKSYEILNYQPTYNVFIPDLITMK